MKYTFSTDPACPSEPKRPVEGSLELPQGQTSVAPLSVERSLISDCQLDSLKVLALTLLREIDALNGSPRVGACLSLHAIVQRFEVEVIRSALIKTGGGQRPAARLLGMNVATLHNKIRRYKLDLSKILPAAAAESCADPNSPAAPIVKANLRAEEVLSLQTLRA